MNKKRGRAISELVDHYVAERRIFEAFEGALLAGLRTNPDIKSAVHFTSNRLKEPGHLRDKLERKWEACKRDGSSFEYTTDNLFATINDLIGVRLIHLSRHQFPTIDRGIREVLRQSGYKLLKVFARTWDDESRSFYEKLGISVETSPTMYTSVHYVLDFKGEVPVTAEIQVRSLAEELWGEVDHSLNYPHPSANQHCREELRVLARLVSTCTRLVDCIYTNSELPPKNGS
jgi:putative GTP pyrophosphokinase